LGLLDNLNRKEGFSRVEGAFEHKAANCLSQGPARVDENIGPFFVGRISSGEQYHQQLIVLRGWKAAHTAPVF